jgi:hypothetical protein
MHTLLDLLYLFRTGVIGWQAGAHQSYAQYAGLHQIQQILIQVNSKNFRPKKVPGFEEIYPVHDELARLGPRVQQTLADKWTAQVHKLGVHK